MATNTLLTPAIITKETLVILENNLVAAAKVNRQFENQFVKIGSTLTVRKPNRYTVSSGPGLQIQNVTEPSTSITISNQNHVDFQFTSQDLTLTIEEFSERYLKPGAAALANVIDYGVIGNFTQIQNLVGTAGTIPNSFSSLAAVGQRMDEGAVPQDGRVILLNPASYWGIATGLSTLYVRSVAEPALKGFLAMIANFEVYMDQNTQAQTWGGFAGTGVVNGANQTGSQIVTNGWTPSITGLFNVGDVVNFAGVFAVNPQSRASTGALQPFVITAQANSDSGGNSTLSVNPSVTTTGAYQTVTNSPANLARVTEPTSPSASTSYGQNLAFVRDAFGLVTVPMELPDGVDFRAREMYKGISMRVIRSYDVNNDVFPTRIDILWGTSTYYAELACRLTS